MSNLSETEKELISELAKETANRCVEKIVRAKLAGSMSEPPMIFKHGPEAAAQKDHEDQMDRIFRNSGGTIAGLKGALAAEGLMRGLQASSPSEPGENQVELYAKADMEMLKKALNDYEETVNPKPRPKPQNENILYLKYHQCSSYGLWQVDVDRPEQRDALRHFSAGVGHLGEAVDARPNWQARWLEEVTYIAGLHGWTVQTEGDPAKKLDDYLADPPAMSDQAKEVVASLPETFHELLEQEEQMPENPTFIYLASSGFHHLIHNGHTYRCLSEGHDWTLRDGHFKNPEALKRAWRSRLPDRDMPKFACPPK